MFGVLLSMCRLCLTRGLFRIFRILDMYRIYVYVSMYVCVCECAHNNGCEWCIFADITNAMLARTKITRKHTDTNPCTGQPWNAHGYTLHTQGMVYVCCMCMCVWCIGGKCLFQSENRVNYVYQIASKLIDIMFKIKFQCYYAFWW